MAAVRAAISADSGMEITPCARNIGWRLDYFLVSAALRPKLKRAFIQPHITGSDHCPVGLELKKK